MALFAAVAVLAGVAPAWPLRLAAGGVAMAAIGRASESGAAEPALLALLVVAVAKLALLRHLAPPRDARPVQRAVIGGLALVLPALLTQPAAPLQALLIGLGAGPPAGLLVLDAAVAAASVDGGPASMWVAAGLGAGLLASRRWPASALAGLLVAALGLALDPSRAGGATMLAGAWLAAGIWPLGRWAPPIAARHYGGVALAGLLAAAAGFELFGVRAWPAGGPALAWVGAIGVAASGGALAVARAPARRSAADAAVQAALVAVAIGAGVAELAVLHTLLRAPLLALGTRAPPPRTAGALRWARAGLPPFGTFWTTLAIATAAAHAQPWLLLPLLPGLLAHVAATWRAPPEGGAVAGWIAWLAVAPAALAGLAWAAGFTPATVGWLS